MNELMMIEQKVIGCETQPAVNARDLWGKLGVRTRFDDWIKRRLSDSLLEENSDYLVFLKNKEKSERGRPQTEYALTLDSAKHVAMMEKTAVGRKIRQYFIDYEKKTRQFLQPIILNKLQHLKAEGLAAKELAEAWGFEGNQAILTAAKWVKQMHGIELELALPAAIQEQLLTPTQLGKSLNISAIEMNKRLANANLQFKEGKVWILTELGKRFGQYLDTGKKHSDGTPVRQIKWLEGVLEHISD